MSVLLVVLACAVFAQATSEFMLAGLVAQIGPDVGVSVAMAGWCTSAFAVGMVIGAPAMALWARRWAPRRSLALFLVVFVAVHVVGALTPSFWLLVVSRVVAALANAGFLAVALTVAVRSVPADRTARATGVLLAGTALALIVGVPAGALLGELGGWRSTFWVVAALGSLALLGVLVVRLPAPPSGARPSVAGEVGVLRRWPVALTLATAVLVNAGTFAAYTYLQPLIIATGGGGPSLVPIALALFGVGAFLGVSMAARIADAHYRVLLGLGGPGLLVGWIALAMLARTSSVALALIGVLGLLAFAVGSGVIARCLALAPDAPTLGGGFTTAALNVGATVGPVLGGAALSAGPRGPAWVAVALVALATVHAGVSVVIRPLRATAIKIET